MQTIYKDPPLPDEAVLVRQAKAGNDEAFTRLYDACVERIYRYVYFRVSDDTATEDLVSQGFLKAWLDGSFSNETQSDVEADGSNLDVGLKEKIKSALDLGEGR